MSREYECNAWQDASIIPPNAKILSENPNDDRTYFYIRIVADFATHLIEDEEVENSHGLPTETLEEAEDIKEFEIPADELVSEISSSIASWSIITSMLSTMEIPEEAHPDVVERIIHRARYMAEDSCNEGSKVLPMIVHIYVEDYIVDEDDDFDMGEVLD